MESDHVASTPPRKTNALVEVSFADSPIGGYVVGEELLRHAFEDASIGGYILSADGRLLRVNAELCRLLGYEPADLLGVNIADITHPEDRFSAAPRQALLRTGQLERIRSETRLVHKDGHPIDIEVASFAIGGLDGTPEYTIAHVQDVTQRKAAEARIAHLAMHDTLTDLPNRALFLDRLGQALWRLARVDSLLAVLFIDLDRFKQVNDGFGHEAGDRALIEVASRLRGALRPEDTLARFGGDEFTILCKGLRDEAAARAVAARILEAVAAPLRMYDQLITLSTSIGIAVTREAATDREAMLHDADLAMYQAKELGRNRFQVYDASMRELTMARIDQTGALRRAIEERQLRVYFQPLHRVSDGSMTGVEALVRWEHPSLGVLGPEEFVQLAEETGQIMALGSWVLEEACRQVAAWAPGFTPRELSVNISAQQLTHPNLVAVIRTALDTTHLDPSRLCLEITESVLMEDAESSIDALRALKELGVRLAIDDFGTGYSSLSYLRRFPVDVVKIDRSFVAGLSVDSASDAIVAAVVNVAHALGFSVVAEGVETEEQLVALRALRCDCAQGYYWSKPGPAATLERWQQSQHPVTVTSSEVDIYSLVAQRIDALRGSTGRMVLLQSPQGLHSAFADPAAIKIILDHLLGNAVAFSPPDRPVVVSTGCDRRWVRMSVADFGIGMTAEQTARCFEQFWQAGESDGLRVHGAGIGLYIVRSLVEAMGGHVAVKSAMGKGSTFTVALPRTARSASRAHTSTGAALDVGEPSSIQEFMRQIGVPMRKTG